MYNGIAFLFFCTYTIPHTNTRATGIGKNCCANFFKYI